MRFAPDSVSVIRYVVRSPPLEHSGAQMLTTENWLTIAGISATTVAAAVGAAWAFYRWKNERPFTTIRRKHYEAVFEQICLGTVPRLTSYDWRVLERRRLPQGDDLRTKVSEAERLDLRYGTFPDTPQDERSALNRAWVFRKCKEGEEVLNAHRLYIAKGDRDLFREYLVLASRFADDNADATLGQLVVKRKELERRVRKILSS